MGSYSIDALVYKSTVIPDDCGGLVPGPLQVPKSADAQVPYIKWCSTEGPLLSVNAELTDIESQLYMGSIDVQFSLTHFFSAHFRRRRFYVKDQMIRNSSYSP